MDPVSVALPQNSCCNSVEDCGVWTRSRAEMQNHKNGKNHNKKSAKVYRFECHLCLVTVTSQSSLDDHMRGKSHIKAVKQLEEQRRKRGEIDLDEESIGYKTGPAEMAKLKNDEYEELVKLRQENKILKNEMKDYQKLKQQFLDWQRRKEKTESYVKNEYFEY